MKIVVLSENHALDDYLEAEFGMSVWIEKNNTRMLFDMGLGDAFIRNAEKLGINLSECNVAAFSHNHRDHCGGFLHAEGILKKDCPVYAHAGFFTEKWWDHHFDDPNGVTVAPTIEQVGPAMTSDYFFKNGWTGFRLLSDDIFEAADGIYLMGNIPVPMGVERVHPSQLMSAANGKFRRDTFRDEQVCVIRTEKGLVLLTGCAHLGVMNIMKTVQKRFHNEKIIAVIGGTHLLPPNERRIQKTVSYMRDCKLHCAGVCHCTGPVALPEFKEKVSAFAETGAGFVYETD